MRVSTKTEYATRALLDLAVAQEGLLVKTLDIARRQRIPKKYLEQILLAFKREGIVRSKSGFHGGYTLARSPELVTMAHIVRAVDGPLAPVRCVSTTAYAPCTCPNEATCPFRTVWQEARDAMVGVLERVTLADVAQRARHLAAYAPEASSQPGGMR